MFAAMFSPVVVAPPAAPQKEEERQVDLSQLEELDEPWTCQIQRMEILLVFGLAIRHPMEPKCEKPAQWVLTCKTCPATILCCDDHLPVAMEMEPLACLDCRTVGRGSDVYRFASLGS